MARLVPMPRSRRNTTAPSARCLPLPRRRGLEYRSEPAPGPRSWPRGWSRRAARLVSNTRLPRSTAAPPVSSADPAARQRPHRRGPAERLSRGRWPRTTRSGARWLVTPPARVVRAASSSAATAHPRANPEVAGRPHPRGGRTSRNLARRSAGTWQPDQPERGGRRISRNVAAAHGSTRGSATWAREAARYAPRRTPLADLPLRTDPPAFYALESQRHSPAPITDVYVRADLGRAVDWLEAAH